jgi:hypothetical protein
MVVMLSGAKRSVQCQERRVINLRTVEEGANPTSNVSLHVRWRSTRSVRDRIISKKDFWNHIESLLTQNVQWIWKCVGLCGRSFLSSFGVTTRKQTHFYQRSGGTTEPLKQLSDEPS